ncbi:phage baseplate assembly protein V [Chryseolinea sp. T2]|uniref:type VI secretion system Vgr family protein n=1 Tax=Chryseolinea sp. T2 TaxID=3129255 RepID=UPI003078776A
MAQKVEVSISVEGEKVSPFLGISIHQDVHSHHSFEIVLPLDVHEGTTFDALQEFKSFIGKKLTIQFGPGIFEKKQSDNQFDGLVTNVSVSRTGNGEKRVIVRGSSPTILMEGQGQYCSFTDKSLNEIADAMMSNVPRSLDSQIDPMYSTAIPYAVQYNESNYAFLQRMAAQYGEWCFYDGMKLIFGKIPKDKTVSLPFGESLTDLDFSVRILPVNNKAVAYNYESNEVLEEVASAQEVTDLDDFGSFALDQSKNTFAQEPVIYANNGIKTKQDLGDNLMHHKSAIARNLVMLSGTSDSPYLNVGTVVDITGQGIREHDYGKFIVTSITHTISGTYSYENGFTGIPAESQSSPSPPIHIPTADLQPGVVVDNNDPESLGRVKVKLFWQKDPETTPWVRVLQTMAGNGKSAVHGHYFIPEIDDEVMVGFEGQNPDKPFVIGSVYHKNVAPSDWQDRDNNMKVLRTRSGNEICFIDKDGSEEIKILNKSSDGPTNIISLSMKSSGVITIETKGDLEMKAKNIKMTASDQITIKSSNATSLEAMNFKQKIDNEVEIKSQKMTIDNTITSVKAKAKLELDGAQSTISAKMLDIDGGATASIKAGLLRLN